MEQCLACLLSGELQCTDCDKQLCESCVKWYTWEENDYSSDTADGDDCPVLSFDIELCGKCFRKR